MVNFENGVTPINDTNLNKMQTDLLKTVFPIGSTYITQENTNPNAILGFGTWERFKGLVALGVDEDDENLNEIGKTGGEKTHTLTIDEMPSHNHGIVYGKNKFAAGEYNNNSIIWEQSRTMTTTKTSGGNNPHNNLQPYEVVGYMWIRRA